MFLVVGAGGIGSGVAARLAMRADVMIIDGWAEHVAAIQQDGLRLTLPNTEARIQLPALTFAEATEPGALPDEVTAVIFAVKSFATAETLDWLVPRVAADVPILSLQNGLNEYLIADRVGADRTIGGVVMFDGLLVGPGHAQTKNPRPPLFIGEWNPDRSLERVRQLAATMSSAAQIILSDDIRTALWGKLLLNCAVNAPSAASGFDLRTLATTPAGAHACAQIAAETVAVAAARGVTIAASDLYGVPADRMHPGGDGVADYEQRLRAAFEHSTMRPSMLTDIERGRPAEIDALNGIVVEYGRAEGVPVPWNEHFCAVIAAIESGQAQSGERWLTL